MSVSRMAGSQIAPVRHTVSVGLAPDAAFDLFANRFDTWWPRDRSADGPGGRAEIVFEPRRGGRWLERRPDGSEQPIGSVLSVDPGKRVVLDWQLDDFVFVPTLHTTVEVTFEPAGEGASVTLEHRDLDRYGPGAARHRERFDATWPLVLGVFAAAGS